MELTNYKFYIGKLEEVYQLANEEALIRGCDGVNAKYWGFILESNDGEAAWCVDKGDVVGVKTIAKLPTKFIQTD